MQVRLLGGVGVRLGGEPLPPLSSARAEPLLAFLLLHRDAPLPRRRIAFQLWPDSTEAQALTNLRHVLHDLRRALPDVVRFLDAGPRTLQWRRDAPLSLDVADFEQAVTEGRLDDAVEAYAGDLLEGNYEDWLLEERERLSRLYVDTLERLARKLEEEGRRAAAIRYAERLLRKDPLREETSRLLMRLHGARGDRAQAVRVYHACATALERELGVEPSAVTREAYDALMPSAREGRPAERRAERGSHALVGRSAEQARLADLWRASAQGRAQLVVVTGEPGIGKSRLVEELRAWCAYRGAVTAEARAYRAEGALAYGGLASWLRSDGIAGRLARLDSLHQAELSWVVPELTGEAVGPPGPEPLAESERRGRLFRVAAKLIAGAGGPLLLVADDLQWFDVQTLQFVHYALRSEPDARVLVAATPRREELEARSPVTDLLAGLQVLDRSVEIELGRLDREETGTLAERITGSRLPEPALEVLFRESEGNPLFVVEAVRAAPAGAGVPAQGASSTVDAVIASRLAQLSEPAGELVGIAATVGREFTTQVLADAADVDEQTFVRSLDELWRRGLVRAQGASSYDFSHDKIRDAAYRALSPAKARHHHVQVALALERSPDDDGLSRRVAAHYDRAGLAREAVDWYERAAEAALRLHAGADAVRSLERALELAPLLPAGDEREVVELRLLASLPAPLVAREGYLSERVAEVHERTLELTRNRGIDPEAPLVRSLALATLTRGDFDAGRVFGEQLRARAEREGDDALWVESAYVLGIAEYWQGHLAPARGHFEDAIERYRPEQRPIHLVRYGQDPQAFCLMRLAHTLWLLGEGEAAERARDEALELADRSGHPYTRAAANAWAAVLALDQGDETGVRRHVESVEAGDVPWQIEAVAETFGGYFEVVDGRMDAGLRRVRRAASRIGRDPAAPGTPGILLRVLLAACAAAGDATAGLDAADEALEVGGGAALWEAEIRRLRAEFLASLGVASQEVEGALARAVEVARRQGARPFELRARESLEQVRAGAGTLSGTLTERGRRDHPWMDADERRN